MIKRTVVLLHGAWMNPESWDGWATRLRARGYDVLAPAWPYDDRPAAELRATPAPELANVGVGEIVAHYEAVIRAFPEPPILIGHSFGGLYTQLLLARGCGACGVAIDPAPIKGVLPAFDAIRAAFPVVSTWGAAKKVFHLSFEDFSWGWVHLLPEAEQRAVYERYVVPTPGRPYMEGLAAPFTSLFDACPEKRTAPLLLVAGEADRTVPASMVRAAHAIQSRSAAKTELRAFPGRTHWICAQDGWEEVCDTAMDWVEGVVA
ncbi:MAG: alpha/beta hydrolase [Pseudomonadota bacterium]|nr:alpha/beta hydrolase [Pseudomonadota bacterium]